MALPSSLGLPQTMFTGVLSLRSSCDSCPSGGKERAREAKRASAVPLALASVTSTE